jgi:hypothetical protein
VNSVLNPVFLRRCLQSPFEVWFWRPPLTSTHLSPNSDCLNWCALRRNESGSQFAERSVQNQLFLFALDAPLNAAQHLICACRMRSRASALILRRFLAF